MGQDGLKLDPLANFCHWINLDGNMLSRFIHNKSDSEDKLIAHILVSEYKLFANILVLLGPRRILG